MQKSLREININSKCNEGLQSPRLQQRCFWHQIQHYKEPLLVFRPSKMIKSRHAVHRALVDLQLFYMKAGKCVSSFPHFRKVKCSDNVCNICAQQFVETNRSCLLTNLLSKHRTPPLQLKFHEQRDLLTHNLSGGWKRNFNHISASPLRN